MRGAFFFQAYVEDHFPRIAADGFEMRFDDIGETVESFFGVAFGGRKGVTFTDCQGLADFLLGDAVEAVEIDQANTGALR